MAAVFFFFLYSTIATSLISFNFFLLLFLFSSQPPEQIWLFEEKPDPRLKDGLAGDLGADRLSDILGFFRLKDPLDKNRTALSSRSLVIDFSPQKKKINEIKK